MVQPYIQRIEQHKTDREVVPKVENKVQNVDKVEVVPYIQRIEQHKTDKEVVPQVKKEVKNMDKVVVQAYIQRIEQHKTDKEVVPKTETKVQQQEKIEVVPFIQREEKHTTQRQVVPQTKDETKKIVKKVIQPIIKDVIQPVHIRIQPVLQEGVKPTIFKKDEIRDAINQGTKTAQTIVKETKVEKEVNAGVKVRESIVRSSVLPTDNKGVVVKKEIISTNAIGLGGAGASVGIGLEGLQISQAMSAEGVHKELVSGTTVRQSIVRSSVLPTIDGGVKVLKPIFGGVRQSSLGTGAGIAGAEFNASASGESTANFGAGTVGVGIGNTTINTTTHNVIDLGTKVHKTIDLGVVNKGVITTTGTGESGLILGQNVDSNGFKMDSNTIQINEGNNIGTSGINFNNSQLGTTIQNQGLSSSGLVMGLGNEGNINVNAQTQLGEITTNNASQFITTGPTTTTSTTKTVNYINSTSQPIIGTTKMLNPIYKTNVQQPIIAGSTMNIQTNQTNA